ncbi:c-type cytochrome [Lacibacter luteus]|uniref:C-type cytochrome n=1 Tax=Lacibacter luteus TaxID=2508719 RepID=A0A4Q1CFE3_9BACT|nr:cytochrome c peroxidase [Lacibacter luteus]RXK58403.1 c-type cytochrome [Lacibacter luteus]
MSRSTCLSFSAAIACLLLIGESCKKKNNDIANDGNALAALNLPAEPFNYSNQPLPVYFNAPNITGQINTDASNPVTNWGATLGRVLFYDKILSINNSISCGSCHKKETGFSDSEITSKGFNNGRTGRHSMSLINAVYYPNRRFFWDERAATLEVQALIPIQDAVEMGMRLDTLVNRLNKTTHYPYLFEKAFGDRTITSDRVARSLAQFVRSMISYRTKFDTGRSSIVPPANPLVTDYPNFTAAENRGKALFFSAQTACATCHGTETFTAPRSENNGLESPIADRGVGAITNNTADEGKFKVPSLKSIELTAPYMHDGRFSTLEQVIEHYNSGIKFNTNLPPQLRNADGTGPRRLNLTQQQKDDLLAFLRTLTDYAIAKDEKFLTPFR